MHSRPQVRLNGVELTSSQAVKALCAKFCCNFDSLNSDEHLSTDLLTDDDSDQLLLLNCTSTDISLALVRCANSSAGPDGFSFKYIKGISAKLTLSLLIIFQQSVSQRKFLLSWRYANVISLYKGKGDRSHPSSYGPICLCSCFGKLLEKVQIDQLTKHISIVKLWSRFSTGF